MTLAVSEIFGPTFQGEGPDVGRRSVFLRLGGCNLNCSWCDTPYTWDWTGKNGTTFAPNEELESLPVRTVADRLRALGSPHLVVTGGEPLLQQRALIELLGQSEWTSVEVETNGTITPHAELVSRVSRFNVSPKLANSEMSADMRIAPDVLRQLADSGKAIFKFVVRDEFDLNEIESVAAAAVLEPGSVWVMPEGTDPETIVTRMRTLAPAVLKRGWNLTSRLHVLIWGNRRGV